MMSTPSPLADKVEGTNHANTSPKNDSREREEEDDEERKVLSNSGERCCCCGLSSRKTYVLT